MACYEPLKALKYRTAKNDQVKILGRFNADVDLDDLKAGKIFTIPCGKCLGCRLDYARHWADRLILEYKANPHAVFVTLTYNDDHLPISKPDGNGEIFSTLVKKHISWFIKKLRARKEFKDITVRFFASGEYGELMHRCHYHLIIFGFDLEYLSKVSELINRGHNELGQIYWQCPLLDSIWSSPSLEKVNGEWKYVYSQLGYVQVSEVSYETMSYVARYSLKKAKGNIWTEDKPIQDEFSLMSRMPGIGYPFLEKHPGIIDEIEMVHYHGKEIYWPRYLIQKYYGKKVRIETPDEVVYGMWFNDKYLDRSERKQDVSVNSMFTKFGIDGRFYDDIIETDKLYKQNSIKSLKRGDVIVF